MKVFHLLVVASGVLLLGFLVYTIGPSALWRQLTLLGWCIVPLILLEGVRTLFHTQGWRHCLAGSHRSLPFARALYVLMAGSSINYLTPTAGLGGEVAKGMLLASDRTGAQAASAVIVDKLSNALAQLIFVTAGCCLLLWKVAMSRAVWFALLSATALLGCGMIAFLLVQIYGKLGGLVRWVVDHRLGGKGLEKTSRSMTDVDGELRRFYRTRPLDFLWSLSWHLAGVAWGIVPTFYFLTLTTGPASLSTAGAIAVLGTWFDMVSFALPVDLGVQETTRVLAFMFVGFPSALGLTYAVTRRLQQLFWAGVGLLLYGLLVSGRRGSSPAAVRGAPGPGYFFKEDG